MILDSFQNAPGLSEEIKGNSARLTIGEDIIAKTGNVLDSMLGASSEISDTLDDLVTSLTDAVPSKYVPNIKVLEKDSQVVSNLSELEASKYLPYLPLKDLISIKTLENPENAFPILITSQWETDLDNSIKVSPNENTIVQFTPLAQKSEEVEDYKYPERILEGDYLNIRNDPFPPLISEDSSILSEDTLNSIFQLQDKLDSLLESQQDFLQLHSKIKDLLGMDYDPQEIFNRLSSYKASILDHLNDVYSFLGMINSIKDMINNLICSICSMFSGLGSFNFVFNLFDSLLAILNAVWQLIKAIYEEIKNLIFSVIDLIKDLINFDWFGFNLKCNCLDKIKNMLSSLEDSLEGAIRETSISGALDHVSDAAKSVGLSANVDVSLGGHKLASGDITNAGTLAGDALDSGKSLLDSGKSEVLSSADTVMSDFNKFSEWVPV